MVLNIKEVQKRLLNIGREIADILDEHNIPYIIIYGTLIGAVRHQGFIPWDDDFDLMLFDESYDEAIDILRSELSGDLFLEDMKSESNFFHAWARVRDLKTRTVRRKFFQDDIYEHKGLTVDLFRIRRTRISDIMDLKKKEFMRYLDRRSELGLWGENDYDKRMDLLRREEAAFQKRIDDEETTESISREVYSNIYNPSFKNYHEISDIFPLKKYKFEDTEFWGPNDYDKILKLYSWAYGDYMTLPPEERRVPHYSSVELLDMEEG